MFNVSVIIPTFNREKYLEKTINSVLSQTFQVYEILICDDGSTDKSKEVVLKFSDKRVKWIDGKHVGLPAAPRNRGIVLSKGNWIAFLDSDDIWLSNKIEEQYKKIKQFGLDAVCSNAIRIIPDNENSTLYHDKIEKDYLTFNDILKSNKIICSSVIINRKIISKTGIFNEHEKFKAIEDYALWLKVSTYTNWTYLNDGLVKYIDDPVNSIRSEGVTELEQRSIILFDYCFWNKNPFSKKFLLAFSLYCKLKVFK
jgi:teichuronic acid biosynthesis glycosyltransferase TuaG